MQGGGGALYALSFSWLKIVKLHIIINYGNSFLCQMSLFVAFSCDKRSGEDSALEPKSKSESEKNNHHIRSEFTKSTASFHNILR